MVIRRITRRALSQLSNIELERGRAAAEARLLRFEAEMARRRELVSGVEEAAVEVASRLQQTIQKITRLAPRVERIIAPVQTRLLSTRLIGPALREIGAFLIAGSGSFTADQLRDAQVRVFFHTEAGFMAEMRFAPTERPFYARITRAEADLLRQDAPPTTLIARLFTAQEPVEH